MGSKYDFAGPTFDLYLVVEYELLSLAPKTWVSLDDGLYFSFLALFNAFEGHVYIYLEILSLAFVRSKGDPKRSTLFMFEEIFHLWML